MLLAIHAQFLETPLHLAAYCGFNDIIETLLRNGAALDGKNLQMKNTPLHVALIRGHAKSANIIIDYGANLDAKNKVQSC
jgi:ankyrin repeat protein